MTAPQPEPWLRGPLPGIPALLQPVGHSLVMALEEVEGAAGRLTPEQLWVEPGGAASCGFHLLHLAGSTDRLFTYARGAGLTDTQRAALAAERTLGPRPALDAMLAGWRAAVDRGLRQLAGTDDGTLLEPRLVGRAQLPSTVWGLLFHAAEHAARHAGQIVTTAKVVRELAQDRRTSTTV